VNVGQSIWDKLTRLVLALLVVAAVLAICLWYGPVVEENRRMRHEKLELERKLEEQIEISKKLETSLRAMQDPRTIERLARERLSYAKPGENVVHFDPPPATNAPAK
jgi:cell division protein FtsB